MSASRGLMALFVIFLIACQPVEQPDGETLVGTGTYEERSYEPTKEVTTKQFSSEEELEAFFKSHQGSGGFGGVRMMAMGAEMAMDMAVAESAPAKAAPQDFSETNVQVVGIDEADIIKTDGNYIYTVSGNTLFIVKAYPGEDAEIVSKIHFEEATPTSLFINDDKLAVFGNFYDNDYFDRIGIRPRSGMTFFDVYDISDKTKPTLSKEFKFEGNYFNGRMMNNHIYLVTQTSPIYRPVPMPMIAEGEVVRNLPIGDIFYFDFPYRNPQYITVHSIDIESNELTDSKSVVAEGNQNMYMSHESIFLTYTQWINEWDLRTQIMKEIMEPSIASSDKELIAKIKATDNDVLSNYEKEQKINQIYQEALSFMSDDEQDEIEEQIETRLEAKLKELEYLEYTVINKIEVENGKIEVEENGKVPGNIINQFSMDEHEEIFRIATTISQRWTRFNKEWQESVNNVYTLNDDLEIIGSLEGLAPGERIFSARFMGDKLFMVTFRQVDPFFVIDLSNPRKPKNLGELKIPGFSRYLHPYDENTIIGIGQDATLQGRTQGLKISLFDVSDVTDPKEIAKYVTESKHAQSTALWEHKAFLFSKDKNLMVIPAYSYDYREREDGYNGAFVFRITKDDIELRGLIDHSSGSERYYGAMVERSLYIEELLYTKSRGLLRINELEDLSSVKKIELKGSGGDFPIY